MNTVALFDSEILKFISNLKSEKINLFFSFVTNFANVYVIIILSLVTIFVLWKNKQVIVSIIFILSICVTEWIVFSGKYFFHRARPEILTHLVRENSFSFPSGHATMAVLFYGFIVYFLFKKYKSFWQRFLLVVFLIILVLLIDLSRLFLGVHYPSDVVAGNLLGFGALVVGILICEAVYFFQKLKLKS